MHLRQGAVVGNAGLGGTWPAPVRGRFHFFEDPSGRRVPVLYGDRVEDGELQLGGEPRPLITGPGRRVLDAAANLCDIAIV